MERLLIALNTLAHIEAMPVIAHGGLSRGEVQWLDLRCHVRGERMPTLNMSDAGARYWLHARAERILGIVEGFGWRHLRAPRIDFDGDMIGAYGDTPARTIHRCEVRVEIAGGS